MTDAELKWPHRWRSQHPQRHAQTAFGHSQVKHAILHGLLVRGTECEECGQSGVAIDAAHDDYSQVLKVRWLCRPCHTRWDARRPKTSDDWLSPPPKPRTEWPSRTHCRRGHERTAENMATLHTGKKVCRICRRMTQKRWDAQRKAVA